MQKHAASRLHYDFRLEIDGVLKSWSIPKGPSTDPADKRLAVQTEDHPLEYGDFEGVIPEGEYGGGTVMLWDRGEFRPEGDPSQGLERGKLSFHLQGEKLRGGYTLLRMRGKGGGPKTDARNWLLVKQSDEDADPKKDLTKQRAGSVKTGRRLHAIAKASGASPGQVERASEADPESPPPVAKKKRRNGDTSITVLGVRMTSPEKVLFREQGADKKALAQYYQDVAEWILPHVDNRPVTLVRCPQGRNDECFYQKHPNAAVPPVMGTLEVEEKRGPSKYMVLKGLPSLVAAVQVGALELHIWGSRDDRPDRPDRMIFDLDPGEGVGIEDVFASAKELGDRLRALQLQSFPLLTGGKGVHVVVPLERRHDFTEVKSFARALARQLREEQPDRYIDQASKDKRRGRIFVDYLRNDRGATAVAPYSTRARAGAPVATPVRWDELGAGTTPDRFGLSNIRRRLSNLAEDPWTGYFELRQRITAAMRKAVGEA